MKTLVIHPKDETTDFLGEIYIHTDWDVINYDIEKNMLYDLIKKYNQVFMMGYGTPYGLLGFNKFVIDDDFVPVLKNKKCVFIWCYADQFCLRNDLYGLCTGMIVSEPAEALYHNMADDIDSIEESNALFALTLSKYINKVEDYEKIKNEYSLPSNNIVSFNKKNIFWR